MIYFCEHGAGAVRLVLYSPPVAAKGQKAFAQGAALKPEAKHRPIVALAALPMEDSLLLVLTADGMLTGCALLGSHPDLQACMHAQRHAH